MRLVESDDKEDDSRKGFFYQVGMSRTDDKDLVHASEGKTF